MSELCHGKPGAELVMKPGVSVGGAAAKGLSQLRGCRGTDRGSPAGSEWEGSLTAGSFHGKRR